MNPPTFIADSMLAKLARWLRSAGLDVAWPGRDVDGDTILRRARSEGRIVLTRNNRFPGGLDERILIESVNLEEQLVEVFRRFSGLDPVARLFTRCMECNGEIHLESDPCDRPADTRDPYTRCAGCGRLYWEGSHVDRIRVRMERVREMVERVLLEEKAGEPPPFERREYDRFLKEAFLLLGYSWRGYRRVRMGLRSRLRARLRELGLARLDRYLELLRSDREECRRLGSILNITISRFFRDRNIWYGFPEVLFPSLVELSGGGPVRAWSVGCASGEEPFTLRMVWEESPFESTILEIIASDLSARCLARAVGGVFRESGIHNVEPRYREKYFTVQEDGFRLDRGVVDSVHFERFDWRGDEWPSGFHLVLARNGIFTYLDDRGKEKAAHKLAGSLLPGGFLWIGGNERMPRAGAGWDIVIPGLFRLLP